MILPLVTSSATTAPSNEKRQQSERKRILLIEDHRDAADALAVLIKLMAAKWLSPAIHGPDWPALSIRPELILCDLGLVGGREGYVVARVTRVYPQLKGVRLVAASVYSQRKHRAAAEQAGVQGFLAKPIAMDTIRAMLNRN